VNSTEAILPPQDKRQDELSSCCCCCCLFKVKKRTKNILIVFILLLIVAIGLAVFFLFPRIPTVNLKDVALDSGSSTAQLGQPIQRINYKANVEVSNPNYFSIPIKMVHIDGIYASGVVGQGGLENLNIPLRSDSVVSIPF
jgi:hypothetical protein